MMLPVLLVGAALVLSAQENVDLNVVHRIKAEAFRKSQLQQTLHTLTDRLGPRLTASPEYDAAAEWIVSRLREQGMSNVSLEKWSAPFGRAWSLRRFSAHMVTPQYAPLIGAPLAWSPSTDGRVTAEVEIYPIVENDMDKLSASIDKLTKEKKGKLRGKILMTTSMRQLDLQLQPPARRYAEADLASLASSPAPELRPMDKFDYSRLAVPESLEERAVFLREAPPAFREALQQRTKELRHKLHTFLRGEGVVAIVTSDRRSDGGTVFGESTGMWEAKYKDALPVIALTPEHYGRIARLLKANTPVKVELEVQAQMSKEDVVPANVVAEIPGTGPKKNEIVVIGAHLDSWTSGTGATDNASGSAVMIETMRILKALDLKMDRTVRMVLWTGEEQGLHGSKDYVKAHYGDPKTVQLKPEHDSFSVYFNLDNGSGKIRGVYLQNNDAARPVFERWLAPFRDLGVTTISMRNTGGTDHLSFDAVGLPGFQFIQDPLEYGTRTHHSNMDVYDHTQPSDLMQASAVMASLVYHAANRAEKMPRKPLPEPPTAWKPVTAAESGQN